MISARERTTVEASAHSSRLERRWPDSLVGRVLPLEYVERAMKLNLAYDQTAEVLDRALGLASRGAWW